MTVPSLSSQTGGQKHGKEMDAVALYLPFPLPHSLSLAPIRVNRPADTYMVTESGSGCSQTELILGTPTKAENTEKWNLTRDLERTHTHTHMVAADLSSSI